MIVLGLEIATVVPEINKEFSQRPRNKPIIGTKEIKLVPQRIILPSSLQHCLEYNSQSVESA